ncbi:MAG: hydroxyacid dehydrogenase [Minwuia sp.]|uniref:hydroxyacid dehydrogenase n=1 Tax=Minwuia sp. TaxID=2493630 RepID=UPI003A8ACFA3
MKRILLIEPMHPAGPDLAAARGGFEVVVAPDPRPETLKRLVGDVHAIGVRIAPLRREVLEAAPMLEIVSRHGVGCDNVDVEYLTARGIPVAIAAGANADSVAEHTLMLMLAGTRNLIRQDRAVRSGRFADRDGLVGGDLTGAHALIVGFGRVGQRVARLCRAFGMRVTVADVALDRDLAGSMGCAAVTDFREGLGEADFVCMHLPLNADTRHAMSGAEFARMKTGAVLVNCARGGVVDEMALVDALECGRVACAGIDVFDQEPPPADHPLLGRDDVVLTPHTGAASRGAMREMSRMTFRNILDFYDGRLREDCTFNGAALRAA